MAPGLRPLPNWWTKTIIALEKAWRRNHKPKSRPKPVPTPAPKPVPVPTPAPGPKPRPATEPVAMFDDVNLKLIPKSAPAVGGYVGGHWPTFRQLPKLFPHALLLSIAVTAGEDAKCLDVESGDATPEQAPAWVRRQHARGVRLPVVYTSAAFLQALVNLLGSHGLKHGTDYLLWSAHYTFHPHFCSPKCGFGIKVTADATQWTDHAYGRSLDQSLCKRTIFR